MKILGFSKLSFKMCDTIKFPYSLPSPSGDYSRLLGWYFNSREDWFKVFLSDIWSSRSKKFFSNFLFFEKFSNCRILWILRCCFWKSFVILSKLIFYLIYLYTLFNRGGGILGLLPKMSFLLRDISIF